MEGVADRRDRLTQLLDLSQVYRGWNRSELARNLKRDPTKLIPHRTAVPKLDLVCHLADALEWPVGDVAQFIWHGSDGRKPPEDERSFRQLVRASKDAHRQGDYREMAHCAELACVAASDSNERAIALNRLGGAWDGLSQHNKALQAMQQGLAEPDLDGRYQLTLEVNLANSHYCLWHLHEARAMASQLILQFADEPAADRLTRVVHAFALYVRGHSLRRMAHRTNNDRRAAFISMARDDLGASATQYDALADEFDDASYRGVANTCRGGIVELNVHQDVCNAESGIDTIISGLEAATDLDRCTGDEAESYGWWCIFGCNIALNYLVERDLQRHMAILTNKAEEIAQRTGNWSLRERIFTMEHARRRQLSQWTGVSQDWVLDHDDVRIVIGAMGRFPHFRRIGWDILNTAQVIPA